LWRGNKIININASIGLILDKIIDRKDIYNILNEIYECRKLTDGGFTLILLHKELKEKQIKEFIKNNKDLLFEIKTEITKQYKKRVWFYIDNETDYKNENYRYKYFGKLENGFVEYKKLINHMKQRDRNIW